MSPKPMAALAAGLIWALQAPAALAEGQPQTASSDASARAHTPATEARGREATGTPAAAGPARSPRRSRADEDARACLEAAENIAVVRCAEKYR